MRTRDSLGVFWHFEDGQQEMDGLLIYGYWPKKPDVYPRFPLGLWPKGTEWKNYEYVSADTGRPQRVNEWTVKIARWPRPEDWKKLIRQTLRAHIDGGATIAWCGLEGGYAEPPELFEDKAFVWAILNKSGRFCCESELDGEFRLLTKEQKAAFRQPI